MNGQAACVIAALVGLLGVCSPQRVVAVDPCPAARNCAEIGVQVPTGAVDPGSTAQIRLGLVQGADDHRAGGVDEVAALTVTLGIGDLQLADCSPPGADGLNPSFELPPAAAGRYRAIVQNLTCAGRAGCLCPDNAQPRDAYVNLLLLGTQTGAGVRPLPNGELLRISLHVPSDASGTLPLHLYSALDDGAPPSGAAALSIADPRAVDLTVDSASDTLNIRITDGELMIAGTTPQPSPSVSATRTAAVTPPASASATATASETPTPSATATATVTARVCVGDCDGSKSVGVNELISGVRIALGALPLSTCPAFDCAGTGEVEVRCLIAAVNAALRGCPGQPSQ